MLCDGVEDGLDRGVLTYSGVDHEMKSMAVRPFNIKVLPDEVGAFLVNGLCKFEGLLFVLAGRTQSPNSFLKRRIYEHVERVGSRPEVIGRTASNDDAVALLCDLRKNLLHDLSNALGVHHPQSPSVQASLKAASHE